MRQRGSSEQRGTEPPLAGRGVGPFLQRDYWAVIRACRYTPVQITCAVRRHFPAFAPHELVRFHRRHDEQRPLARGDEMDVHILGVPRTRVCVTHVSDQSITLATEAGHPEAGRITFGAYRNRRGDVIFHIRSRARSSSRMTRAGFLASGEVMQTSCWTDFVNRVAVAFGNGVVGFIQADTRQIHGRDPEESMHEPTFEARGG